MTDLIEMFSRLAENEMFGGMLAVGIVGGDRLAELASPKQA